MVERTDGVELLLDVGLQRLVTGSAEVRIMAPDGRWQSWEVKAAGHSPSPAEISRARNTAIANGSDGVLFVVAAAGSALTSAAQRDARVGYAAVRNATVSLHGQLHRATAREVAPVPQGRTSFVRFGVLRLFALLEGAVLSQSAIGRQLGASHVAVAKQLSTLEPLVRRTGDGWSTGDRGACWEAFMASYPGPQGLSTFWMATGTTADQLSRIESTASASDRATSAIALSGDHAADFYAPWRRPTRLTGYVTRMPDMDSLGFAEVRQAEATVELRLPKDRTVLAMSRDRWDPRWAKRFVDPVLAAWDLRRTGGGDVEAAVQHLRDRALATELWS